MLDGQGIDPTGDGRAQTPLAPRQAYAFAGDAQVQCRLLNGPIRDFNLIYAPARWHARLQWVAGAGPWAFHSAASEVLVLTAGGALVVRINGAPHALPSRYDCLHAASSGGLAEYRLEAEAPLDACVIELLPRKV